MKRFTSLIIAVCAACEVHAQGTPAGTKGQDWDQRTIEIQNGIEVTVTAQVATKNTKSGNASSVILFVNGAEVRRAGGDRAENTLTYRLAQNGRHSLEIRCSNSRADADTCTLDVSRSNVEVFR